MAKTYEFPAKGSYFTTTKNYGVYPPGTVWVADVDSGGHPIASTTDGKSYYHAVSSMILAAGPLIEVDPPKTPWPDLLTGQLWENIHSRTRFFVWYKNPTTLQRVVSSAGGDVWTVEEFAEKFDRDDFKPLSEAVA